jgi:DnaJ-class molecular chaperone
MCLIIGVREVIDENGIIDSCMECGGAGMMPVPKTYKTCPCCQGREKERPCKKCNTRGYQILQEDDGEI